MSAKKIGPDAHFTWPPLDFDRAAGDHGLVKLMRNYPRVLYDPGLFYCATPGGLEERYSLYRALFDACAPELRRTALAVTYWANGFSVALEPSLEGRQPPCGCHGDAMELGKLHRDAGPVRAFAFYPWGEGPPVDGTGGKEVERARMRERFAAPLGVLRAGDLDDPSLLQPPHTLLNFPKPVLAAIKALLPPSAPFETIALCIEWRLYNQFGGRHRKLCHRAQLVCGPPESGGGGGGGDGLTATRPPPLESTAAAMHLLGASSGGGGADAGAMGGPAARLPTLRLSPAPSNAAAEDNEGGGIGGGSGGGGGGGDGGGSDGGEEEGENGDDSPPTPTPAAAGRCAGLLAVPPPASFMPVAFVSVAPIDPPPDVWLVIFSNGILIDGLALEGCTTIAPAVGGAAGVPPESDDASVLSDLHRAGLLANGSKLSFLPFLDVEPQVAGDEPTRAYKRVAKLRATETLRSVFNGRAPEWLRLEARNELLRVRVADFEGSGYTHMDAQKVWKGKVLFEKAHSLAEGAGAPLEAGEVRCEQCGKGVATMSLGMHQLRCGKQPRQHAKL